MFIRSGKGLILMANGYTYSKSDKLNWYCSKRTRFGCKAKVRLSNNCKYIDKFVNYHDHEPPKYVVTSEGRYIKL